MKNFTLAAAAMLLIATSCKKAEDKAIDTTPSTDTTVVVKEETPVKIPDTAEMNKAWKMYMTPGEPQKIFAMDNGTWDEESIMYMNPDDKEGVKTKMTAVSKMILGGRYQEMRHTGVINGMPFEGVGVTAYNNASKEIQSSWVDNMGTGIMYMSGPYDGKSKKMELKGQCADIVTGKMKVIRETFEIVDENTRKMEMFDTWYDGTEYKSMELVMTRRK